MALYAPQLLMCRLSGLQRDVSCLQEHSCHTALHLLKTRSKGQRPPTHCLNLQTWLCCVLPRGEQTQWPHLHYTFATYFCNLLYMFFFIVQVSAQSGLFCFLQVMRLTAITTQFPHVPCEPVSSVRSTLLKSSSQPSSILVLPQWQQLEVFPIHYYFLFSISIPSQSKC